MTILLLGATGRTGQELLRQALQAGISVHAVVRKAATVVITSPNLTLFDSPALDKPVLKAAMLGCNAVLSTLSISRTYAFPWSRLRTPPLFLSDTLRHVLNGADELAVQRIILTTAWGVSETIPDLPFWFRWLIDYSNLGPAYRDHERQEQLLANSSCQWTVVRPVILTNSQTDKRVIVSRQNTPVPHLTISRPNVAKFMLHLYQTQSYLRQTVTISKA